MRDFVDVGALLGVDDVGVRAEVDAQQRRLGLGHRGRDDDLFLLDDLLNFDDLGLDDLDLLLDDLRHDFLDDLRLRAPGRR